MSATVPIDIALNLMLGSWFAHEGRGSTAAGRGSWLESALAFELLVFLPIGAYLLAVYPDWSLMYLVDPSRLPAGAMAALLLAYPAALLAGFASGVAWRRRGGAASRVTFAFGLLENLVTLAGFRRLITVTDFSGYRSGVGVPIWEHRLALELAAIVLLFVALLGLVLRRGRARSPGAA